MDAPISTLETGLLPLNNYSSHADHVNYTTDALASATRTATKRVLFKNGMLGAVFVLAIFSSSMFYHFLFFSSKCNVS